MYADSIEQLARKYSNEGDRTLSPFGTRLIGHRPDAAAQAYTIILFPPVDEHDFNKVMEDSGETFHPALRELYRAYNGFHFFNSFSMYGIPSYMHDPGYQPWNMLVPNYDERPRNAPETAVFFGTYVADGSLLFMTLESDEVYRCKMNKASILSRWTDLETMLVSELDRLDSEFEASGRDLEIASALSPPPRSK